MNTNTADIKTIGRRYELDWLRARRINWLHFLFGMKARPVATPALAPAS